MYDGERFCVLLFRRRSTLPSDTDDIVVQDYREEGCQNFTVSNDEVLVLFRLLPIARGLDNGLSLTPPMGYNVQFECSLPIRDFAAPY